MQMKMACDLLFAQYKASSPPLLSPHAHRVFAFSEEWMYHLMPRVCEFTPCASLNPPPTFMPSKVCHSHGSLSQWWHFSPIPMMLG